MSQKQKANEQKVQLKKAIAQIDEGIYSIFYTSVSNNLVLLASL